jgi:hypothetical protein
MPKLPRAHQKIFADAITATGNIAEFGSLAEGSPAYSKDPDAIQSRPAWGQGWIGAVIGNQSPAYQDFNAYQFLATRQLAYLFQSGIPEWNALTPYYIGSWCLSNGVAYRSKTDDNIGNPVTDTVNWAVTGGDQSGTVWLDTPFVVNITAPNDTWRNYDLSSVVPANAKSVIIEQYQAFKTGGSGDVNCFIDFCKTVSGVSPVGPVYYGLRSNDDSTTNAPETSFQGQYPLGISPSASNIGIKRKQSGSPSPIIRVIAYST